MQYIKFNIGMSDNNQQFLKDTRFIDVLSNNDLLLRPNFTINRDYDIIFGNNTVSPLKYEIANRNFLYITEGEVEIKLCVPRDEEYLCLDKDYEYLEYRSLLNPWNPQKEYMDSFNKIRFITLKMSKGDLLYLPPFWLYSIKFITKTIICKFQYTTLINFISCIPEKIMYFLQNQNIEFKTNDSELKIKI